MWKGEGESGGQGEAVVLFNITSAVLEGGKEKEGD